MAETMTEYFGNIDLTYAIEDTTSDLYTINMNYSQDNGDSWSPATLQGNLVGLGIMDYIDSLTWLSDDDSLVILIKSGINEDFIDKEIPEFILYWTERKEESDIWNSKFIAHIRRQWGRFKDIKENDDLPSKMTSEWRPNEDFFDILELTDIPREFAENTKPEFIMYWKETGQSLNSWNSKFLQHVKYNWEKTNKGQTPQLSNQIERRIESSWKIEESSVKRATQPDNEMIQEKFKKLKEKHQI